MMVYAPHLEPFGYAPLEANACGTPVVALAEGGVRETVHHEVNGLLVSHASSELFAAAMERLIDEPRLSLQLGRQGQDRVKTRWDLEASTTRLITHLEELLDRQASIDR